MLLFCCNAQPKGCVCHSNEYENRAQCASEKALASKVNEMFTTMDSWNLLNVYTWSRVLRRVNNRIQEEL